jgi:hypothetical protein
MSPTNYNYNPEKSVNKVYPHYGINIFNPDPKKPETPIDINKTGYNEKENAKGGKRKSRKQKKSLRRKSRKARKSQKKRR